MADKLIVSFHGAVPSRGQVDAYTSFESMLALSQAATMIIHFAETGTIRRKKFAELDVDLRLSDTREGSFEFLLEYQTQAAFIGGFVANAMVGGLLWDIIKGIITRVIGGNSKGVLEELENDEKFNEGDIGALVQALEPAVRRSHSAIGRGANKIVISVEGKDDEVVFDNITKKYLLKNIVNDEIRTQRFHVTSFDGRARTGRIFHLDDKQAYTFEISTDAKFSSLRIIADAARAYALRSNGQFDERLEAVIRYTSIDAADGRMKKILVLQAAESFDDLDSSPYEPE